MKVKSIKFKIGVLYVTITLLIVFIMIRGISYFSRYHAILYRGFDGQIRMKAQEINNAVKSYLDALGGEKKNLIFAVRKAIRFEDKNIQQDKIEELDRLWFQKAAELGLRNDFVNFSSVKGKSIVSSANMDVDLRTLFGKTFNRVPNREIFTDFVFRDNNLRIISVPFTYDNLKGNYVLQVGSTLPPVISILRERLFHIALGISIILAFTGVIGLVFVNRFLKPLIEIAGTVKNISRDKLSLRLNTNYSDEEIRYLSGAFNDMISRLEESFRYISEFSSHVAHELKTPLAILKGESEVALRKDRDAVEYRRVIEANVEEVDRMIRTIDDLLLLTRLDYQRTGFKFEPFELIEFLRQIFEHSGILALQKNILFNVNMRQKELTVKGDRLHLRRLFFNVIDNAIKFTPPNGSINITVKCRIKKVAVSIADTGPGIPAEELPNIFKRFYRVHTVNYAGAPMGQGLGLSIAKSIARIHGGDIEVASESGKGSVFTVDLPLL